MNNTETISSPLASIDSRGKSKHNVKGTAVKNFQKYVEHKLSNEHFRKFLTKSKLSTTNTIISSTWYPVELYIEMHKMCAAELKMTLKDFVIAFTRYHLEIDMNGVYQFFMRASGPIKVLSNIPRIDKAYSDYTLMEMVSNEKGRCVSEIHVPKPYSEWYIWTLVGGFTGLLNVCKTPMKSFKVLEKSQYEKAGELMEITRMEVTY
ncbi:MAG: heme NO-binding domain-containing protein [Cyclobacteriaceae bacterium]